MTNGLTSPKATDRPPGPTPEAARGAPPPSDAFAGMLDAQQARTATAEGQSPEKSAPADDCATPAPAPTDKDKDTDATPAPDPNTTAAAAVLAALPVPVAPTVSTPETQAAAPAVEAPVPTAKVDGVAAPAPVVVSDIVQESVAVPVAAETPAAVDTTPAATPVTVAKPDVPVQAPVAQPVAPAQPKPEAQSPPAAAPAQPVPAATAGPQLGQQASEQQQQPQPQGQPQAGPQQVSAPQPAAQPQAPVAPAAPPPPAAAARAALPTPTATPVPLPRAAEAVEHLLRVATSRGGVTHARIALRPAELGSVDVHIRSTAEGLVARVVAHTAEAVQTLQHAANDLRQSLEEKGLNLKSLDIGQPGERDAGRAGADAGDKAASADSGLGGETDDTATETSTLRLPSGVLVDVLA